MIEIRDMRLPLEAGLPDGLRIIREQTAKRLAISPDDIAAVRLLKRSVDARKKSDVHFVATVAVTLAGGEAGVADAAGGMAGAAVGAGATGAAVGAGTTGAICSRYPAFGGPGISAYTPPEPVAWPVLDTAPKVPPVVVGAGPAGLFAALRLAAAGACPHLIERGGDVAARRRAVAAFDETGVLDPNCNVQFGEGGAGTFSDGKLSTGTHDERAAQVLQTFVDAGAPDEILWQAHPHIGTDFLPTVVSAIRNRIIALGGTVEFCTKLAGIGIDDAGGLRSIEVEEADGTRRSIEAHRLVLATGHSARDTFEMLCDAGMELQAKPFSIGVRIEHLQHDIDVMQYGSAAGHPALGAAEYHLATHMEDGRGVYSFCMCPGGTVVAAASEAGGVVTNGMSVFARDGKNSNAGLLVNVGPADFACDDPSIRPQLAGVEFQRRWERAAFRAGLGEGDRRGNAGNARGQSSDPAGFGTYRAPAQLLGDFLLRRPTSEARASAGRVIPSYPRGVVWCDLSTCLPRYVAEDMREAVHRFGAKLRGFDANDAVLTGIETRSSSPVRMVRDETLQSTIRGIYPCGEGAGYAGGIMSAAVDGLRVAEAVLTAL